MQTQVRTQADPSDKIAGLEVAVEERQAEPGVWTVEAIDMAGDGCIYQAIFVGPDAQERAKAYARFKYGRSP